MRLCFRMYLLGGSSLVLPEAALIGFHCATFSSIDWLGTKEDCDSRSWRSSEMSRGAAFAGFAGCASVASVEAYRLSFRLTEDAPNISSLLVSIRRADGSSLRAIVSA